MNKIIIGLIIVVTIFAVYQIMPKQLPVDTSVDIEREGWVNPHPEWTQQQWDDYLVERMSHGAFTVKDTSIPGLTFYIWNQGNLCWTGGTRIEALIIRNSIPFPDTILPINKRYSAYSKCGTVASLQNYLIFYYTTGRLS